MKLVTRGMGKGSRQSLVSRGLELVGSFISSLFGAKGPMNPYDYLNIMTTKKFKRKIVVNGTKRFLVGVELGFEGSKEFYESRTIRAVGIKKIPLTESKVVNGTKKFEVWEYRECGGTKQFTTSRLNEVRGSKLIPLTEKKVLRGKRDFMSILVALDLFSEKE